jgi:uncharacterized protein (DUF1015 family)
MANVKPFRGLRPVQKRIHEVASPPYDVLSSAEAREKAKDNPNSFLHIIKPEIDLDPSIDIHDSRVYTKGSENLKRLIREGILIQDEKPNFYIYKLRMGQNEQIGLVAVASVEDYLKNKIKKHEHTRPDKEKDRMEHINHLNAQTGPVFLTYYGQKTIDRLMDEGMVQDPIYDFIGDYDVKHTFYIVDDENLIGKIEEEFKKIDALYVADGHHRSAAALRVRELRMKQNPDHTGKEEYNYFLTVIFPDYQMHILDYNRVVSDLNGMSSKEFLARISDKFEIQSHTHSCCNHIDSQFRPQEHHTFGMYLDNQWYVLKAKQGSFNENDPISRLDVSILQDNLLSPVLSIQDPRTDQRIHFVGGIRGLKELEGLVDKGNYAVAFSLFPTTIDQLLTVADDGQVMPPKSTWFEPKLRSGIVVHMLD